MADKGNDKAESMETVRSADAGAADTKTGEPAGARDAEVGTSGKRAVHHVRPADVPSLFSTSHVTWLVVGIIIGAVLMALAIKTSVL